MTEIKDVSDTAIWVAYYRAQETESANALFHDPLAKKLMGDRGERIAKSMSVASEYTRQNVVIRTYLIDRFLGKLINSGVDTVINLGAGLDTRPYRLDLPSSLRWVEVDYPHMIELKNKNLGGDLPKCQLERVSLDLSDVPARELLFTRLASNSKRAVIITEGVLPYLTQDQVSSLANDLHKHPAFEYWICDYMARETYKYINDPNRMKKLMNAPFQFFPDDWFGFFAMRGWTVDDIKYIQKTTVELGRKMPMPLWARPLRFLMPKQVRERMLKMSGYMILRRS